MRRVLLAVLVTAATTMMMAGPAAAGGPTSVLLTSPGTARAAALYYTDPRYAELEALLHGPGAEVGETSDYPGTAGATQLNITWLVHDVTTWRTDQLVLGATGGPWVATWMTLGEGDEGGDGGAATGNPTWRALTDGPRIKKLVSSLGLLGGARSNGARTPETTSGLVLQPPAAADNAGADAGAAGAAPTEPPVENQWFTLAGWRWAVPGLLLGLFAGWAVRRNDRAGPGPRQEFVDGQFIDGERERTTAPG